MKWTRIELLLVLSVVACIASGVSLGYIAAAYVEKAGGVKQIIINVGKEFKDIRRQINDNN